MLQPTRTTRLHPVKPPTDPVVSRYLDVAREYGDDVGAALLADLAADHAYPGCDRLVFHVLDLVGSRRVSVCRVCLAEFGDPEGHRVCATCRGACDDVADAEEDQFLVATGRWSA